MRVIKSIAMHSAGFEIVLNELLAGGPNFSPSHIRLLHMLATNGQILPKLIHHLTDVLNNSGVLGKPDASY